jgi:hypothetical protein
MTSRDGFFGMSRRTILSGFAALATLPMLLSIPHWHKPR